jgi:hypothetical protein
MALNPKVTIVVPVEVLEAIKQKAKASGSNVNDWTLFALIKSLKDTDFAWDLKQSDLYLDHQLDL